MKLCDVIETVTDERGTIEDLLATAVDSVTRIWTKKGAVRGNHYHEKTIQWTYVVSGRLMVVTFDPLLEDKQQTAFLHEDQMMVSPPGERHAWKAMENTTVLVFTLGPRSGSAYESDTHRLTEEERLIFG